MVMIGDRVGDFIIRLKNAGAVKREWVEMPYSSQLQSIAEKLRELGFIGDIERKQERTLRVGLLYDEKGAPRIRNVRRISKPGRRIYTSHRQAHAVAGGTGVNILSTPRGVLSDAEVRRQHVGGEVLFAIW